MQPRSQTPKAEQSNARVEGESATIAALATLAAAISAHNDYDPQIVTAAVVLATGLPGLLMSWLRRKNP